VTTGGWVRLINLTPHAVTLWREQDPALTIPPDGRFARLDEEWVPGCPLLVGDVEVPIAAVTYRGVEDLPEPQAGVAFVVSRVLAAAVPDRRDLYFPADEVRDASGRVIGCRRLGTFWSLHE